MSGEAWLYLLAVLINAVNLFLQVFFTIMYSDLEWWVLPFSFCKIQPLTDSEQRLHQPYRSLQPPQHLHCSRSRCSRILDIPLPYQRVLVGYSIEFASHRLQRKEVSPHPWSSVQVD